MNKERLIEGVKRTSQASVAFGAIALGSMIDSDSTLASNFTGSSKSEASTGDVFMNELPSETQWRLSTANNQGLEKLRDWSIEAKIPVTASVVAVFFLLRAFQSLFQ